MKKTSVPLDVINNIEIASPCPANWHEMTGDAQKRHCEHCDLEVYNLSEMTSEEAADLLASASGLQCVRIYRRQDGSAMTRDCPWRERMKLRTQRWVAAVVGLMGIGWAAALGCIMGQRVEPTRPLMGTPRTEQSVPTCGDEDDKTRVTMGRRIFVEELGEIAPATAMQPEFGERYETQPLQE